MSKAKFTSIAQVGKLVADANISDPSSSEIAASKAIYSPKVIKVNEQHILFLVDHDNDRHRYRITPMQLACVRVGDGKNAGEYSSDFLQNPSLGWRFHTTWLEMQKLGIELGDVSMVCYHQVKLRNFQVSGRVEPLYKDYCYSKIDEFRESIEALDYNWLRDGDDEEKTKAYYANRRKFRNILHRSPLFTGFDVPENLDLVPAFTVSK
jgi:hypothetical protein